MDELKKSKGGSKKVMVTIVVAVVCLGVGFLGGMQYQKSQKSTRPTGINQQGMPSGSGAPENGRQDSTRGTGNQPVSGEVTSIDDGAITISTNDGGSKIVIISDSTTINVTSEGSILDLTEGDEVTITGTANSDGTVTATFVTVGGRFIQGGNPGDQTP